MIQLTFGGPTPVPSAVEAKAGPFKTNGWVGSVPGECDVG